VGRWCRLRRQRPFSGRWLPTANTPYRCNCVDDATVDCVFSHTLTAPRLPTIWPPRVYLPPPQAGLGQVLRFDKLLFVMRRRSGFCAAADAAYCSLYHLALLPVPHTAAGRSTSGNMSCSRLPAWLYQPLTRTGRLGLIRFDWLRPLPHSPSRITCLYRTGLPPLPLPLAPILPTPTGGYPRSADVNTTCAHKRSPLRLPVPPDVDVATLPTPTRCQHHHLTTRRTDWHYPHTCHLHLDMIRTPYPGHSTYRTVRRCNAHAHHTRDVRCGCLVWLRTLRTASTHLAAPLPTFGLTDANPSRH